MISQNLLGIFNLSPTHMCIFPPSPLSGSSMSAVVSVLEVVSVDHMILEESTCRENSQSYEIVRHIIVVVAWPSGIHFGVFRSSRRSSRESLGKASDVVVIGTVFAHKFHHIFGFYVGEGNFSRATKLFKLLLFPAYAHGGKWVCRGHTQ